MKAESDQPYDHQELQAALTKGGLIRAGQEIVLRPYPVAFPRRSRFRRGHYQVVSGDRTICHLIVGLDLSPVHARAKEFHLACPGLVCRPLLFWKKADGLGYLCLEHFAGTSLDTLVAQGNCPPGQWLEFVRRAQGLLETTRKPSSQTALGREIAALQQDLRAFTGMTSLDLTLVRDFVQPALLAGDPTQPLSTRWSNADFVGRNLLISAAGELRLIDYEFAAPTHFGDADWLRLLHFSVRPPQLDEAAIKELTAARKPGQEIWLWLHQLAQLSRAESSADVQHHVADTVSRLFAAIGQVVSARPPANGPSMLLEHLATQQGETRRLLEKRTTWAQSLEQELQQARAAVTAQSKLAEERLAWVRSAETEQGLLKTSVDRLTTDYAGRTAWAKSLEAELQSVREKFANASREFAERTVWAESLKTDLRTVQAALADQTKLAEERTAWAKSLEAELQSVREKFTNASREFAERTAWAESLVTDLREVRAALADQTKLAGERTAWAKSLEAELRFTKENFNRLSGEFTARTVWAKSLEAELVGLKSACAKLAANLPGLVPDGELAQLDQCRAILADLQRDLAARNAAADAATGNALDNQLRAEEAEAEVHRLKPALADAQLHVEHLLGQARNLQQSVHTLGGDKQAGEEILRQREQELAAAIAQHQAISVALARYESSRICRLAARLAGRLREASVQP